MNALVPQDFGPLPAAFAGDTADNELGAGISGGFGSIGFKGKVWSIKARGEERQLMRDDGDGPRGSIELVIIKASPVISKVWYEKGFVDGDSAPPDCFSTNGVTPDAASTKKQCSTCAGCPMNVFGSAMRQDGTSGKGKACSDSKRTAVVPLGDVKNEMYGGPMLLRVPASSLGDVAMYGEGLKKMGYPSHAVGTRIAFDAKEAFPKFVFSPIRALTEAEALIVKELRDDPRTDRILAADIVSAPAAEPATPAMQFEQPAAVAAPAVAPAGAAPQPAPVTTAVAQPAAPPKTRPKPAAAKPAPAPVAAPAAQGGFGATAPAAAAPVAQTVASPPVAPVGDALIDDLDAQLDGLMNAPAAA